MIKYSEHVLQKLQEYLVRIANNNDLKWVYVSTNAETQPNCFTHSAYKYNQGNKHTSLNTSHDANVHDDLVK